jgi:hypothetical protein
MTTDVEILRGNHIKSGDTLPSFRVKLLEDGDAFNLSNYDVTMKIRLAEGGDLKVDDSASIEQEDRGIVTYDWSSSQTDTAGTYDVEFVANDGGDTISFPNSGFARLYIEEGL